MHWRLLSVWVTGVLTLGLCRGRSVGEEDNFESTTADYDYENTTFEYYFFSNGSGTMNYDVYVVLNGEETRSKPMENNVKSASDIANKASLSAPIVLLTLPIQRLFYPL